MSEQQSQSSTSGVASELNDELGDAPKETHWCSFCGRTNLVAKKIIAADGGVCICDTCIEMCRDILGAERAKKYL